jgi:hypothetical protein
MGLYDERRCREWNGCAGDSYIASTNPYIVDANYYIVRAD